MSIIQKPTTTFSITSQPADVVNQPQRVLFVGQQSGGTSTSGVVVKDIGTTGQEDALFGSKSMLSSMVRSFRAINTAVSIDAIPLDDAIGSVKAEGLLAFSGTSTVTGNVEFIIQSKILHSFSVNIVAGTSSDDVALAVAAAINEDTEVNVIALTTTPSQVIIQAVNGGTIGNELWMSLSLTPPGITLSIFNDIGALIPGSLDPNLDNLFDAIINIRYQTIVWPSNYDNTVVNELLEGRFNTVNSIFDGIALSTKADIESNLIAEANALDSIVYVLIANKKTNSLYNNSAAIFEFNPVISSQIAAIRSLRLTLNQNISSFLVGSSLSSSFGGPELAAIPYQNTPFNNLPTIDFNQGWSKEEQINLNNNGVSFLGNDISRTKIIAGELVTTSSNSEFKFLNYVDTASVIREYFYNKNINNFSQSTLTLGDVVPGLKMVNDQTIAVYQSELYDDLSGTVDGTIYNLTQTGTAANNFFNDNLSIVIDLEPGKATIAAQIPITTQLRNLSGTVQIVFDLTTTG